MELESKAVTAAPHSPEVKEAFEDFLRAFEGFKSANDERLAGLERRSGDVVSDEKVERINRVLEEQKQKIDNLTLAAARPAFGGERKADARDLREKKAAFDRYVRKGAAGGLDALKVKTLSAGSNPTAAIGCQYPRFDRRRAHPTSVWLHPGGGPAQLGQPVQGNAGHHHHRRRHHGDQDRLQLFHLFRGVALRRGGDARRAGLGEWRAAGHQQSDDALLSRR